MSCGLQNVHSLRRTALVSNIELLMGRTNLVGIFRVDKDLFFLLKPRVHGSEGNLDQPGKWSAGVQDSRPGCDLV